MVSPSRQDRVARLCRLLDDRLDDVGVELTRRIREEIPSYGRVPLAEHRETVREQARTLLAGLAAGAEPTAEQLRWTQVAARRRAYQGLAVYDVLAAFHIVPRALWDALGDEDEAAADPDALVALLGSMWTWTQSMSSVVADAYAEETGARQGHEVSLRHRLFEALRGGGGMVEQAAELARELEYDPARSFQAFCAPAGSWPQKQIDLLQRGLQHLSGTVHCGLRGDVLIALAQDVDAAEVSSRMARLAGPARAFGVGLERLGLAGADMSIADAERALVIALARGEPIARFEDVWMPAMLAGSRERLDPLLATGRAVARQHPQLAETVTVFAESGFTLAGAAETLIVHPNTVAYRLGRWEKLTGWDPRSLPGLLRSIAALTIPDDTGPVESTVVPAEKSSVAPMTDAPSAP